MRKPVIGQLSFIVCVFILSMSVQGCNHFQTKKMQDDTKLVGSWKLKDPDATAPTVLTLKEDETFLVDVGGDGRIEIRGVYEIYQNRIKFTDIRTEGPMTCNHSGFYYFRLADRVLDFDLFVDECKDRKEILKLGWKSIPVATLN